MVESAGVRMPALSEVVVMTDEYPQDTLKRWITSDVGLALITIGFYIAFYLMFIWIDGFWWGIEKYSEEAILLLIVTSSFGVVSGVAGLVLLLQWFDEIYNEVI